MPPCSRTEGLTYGSGRRRARSEGPGIELTRPHAAIGYPDATNQPAVLLRLRHRPPTTLAAQQPTVLRAAAMLDVIKGELVRPAVLVIEGGRIRSIGPGQLPAGARTVDLEDMTLLPGLIDAHTHLTLTSKETG